MLRFRVMIGNMHPLSLSSQNVRDSKIAMHYNFSRLVITVISVELLLFTQESNML